MSPTHERVEIPETKPRHRHNRPGDAEVTVQDARPLKNLPNRLRNSKTAPKTKQSNAPLNLSQAQREETLAQEFNAAYRHDVMNCMEHFLRASEGSVIARVLEVKARVMKHDPKEKGSIEEHIVYGNRIKYGEKRTEGTLLQVNDNHFVVIEPTDGNSKGAYCDSTGVQYEEIYNTVTGANSLLDGLYYIKHKQTVPLEEARDLRIHAAGRMSNGRVAAVRPILREIALSGSLTGVGPRTKAFFDKHLTPRTQTEPSSESESDSEIDNLWNNVHPPEDERDKTENVNQLSKADTALLDKLNEEIRSVKSASDIERILRRKEYRKFVVAQYRGITYTTHRFPTDARRKHRKSRPIGVPIYPDALRAEGQAYHDFYMMAARGDEELDKKLAELRKWYRATQKMEGLYDRTRERVYPNRQAYFQGKYSQAYAESQALISHFHNKGKKYKKKLIIGSKTIEIDSAMREVYEDIPFRSHPLVSTSDTPKHAVRYALGKKAIESEKEFRLHPLWSKTGRAAHPYTGMVSVSFHPLRDYLSPYAPSHLFSARKLGTVTVDHHISQEAESSFLAIKPRRVVLALPVRWPSLAVKDDGLRSFDIKLKQRQKYRGWLADPQKAPKEDVQKTLESALGGQTETFLVTAIARAVKAEAKRRNKIVIYRGLNGDFVTEPPKYESSSIGTSESWKCKTDEAANSLIEAVANGTQPSGHLTTGHSRVGFPRSSVYDYLSGLSDAEQNKQSGEPLRKRRYRKKRPSKQNQAVDHKRFKPTTS